MDKTYAQRLHKYEMVLRGFYLTSLRLQIKPYKDFYINHGYLGQPSELIVTDGLKIAYINSYRFISDAESYRQWQMLDYEHRTTQKDMTFDDGFLILSETLKSFFLQASIVNYNNIRDDLNATTIQSLTNFVNKSRASGYTDAEIYAALNSVYENELRNRSAMIAATEATTIIGLVNNQVSAAFFNQKGVTGYKGWFTRQDERVRHTHVEVDGRVLPMDTPFVLNRKRGGVEFADYPGDVKLSAENRVNCRCYVQYASSPTAFTKKGA